MTMISAVAKLTVALALLVVFAGAAKSKCETKVSKFEKCLKKGYKPQMIESRVKVDKKFKGDEAKCLKIEKSVKKKCGSDYVYGTTEGPEIKEWTPIFNTTTDRYNVGDFHVKFTQHKTGDKYLYLSQSVYLYNDDGVQIGHTNFIFYLHQRHAGIEYSAYKRFYFSGPYGSRQCSRKIDLSYLADEGFSFEMITTVGSADMYQFIVSGEQHNENMADCDNYETWQEMLKEASTAEMKLLTWVEDLPDYFTTEYKVVY